MSRLLLVLFPLALAAQGVAQDGTLSRESLMQAAIAGQEQDLPPGEVTARLIEQGFTAPRSVYAVATVYNDCDAMMEIVAAASQMRPDEVEAIVTSTAGLKTCGCSTETVWARTRIQTRLRPTTPTQPIELQDSCGCVTAAVEAAVATLPDRSDRIVRAAVEARQRLRPPLTDSIGDRSAEADEIMLNASAPPAQTSGIFRRRPAVCEGDTDDADDFVVEDEWTQVQGLDDLGRHDNECEDDGTLLISEFLADPEGGSYVELYNASEDPIELSAYGFRLSVFYQGVDSRGISTELAGTVEPQTTYVIASTSAPAAAVEKADLLIPHLDFAVGDTLDLHPGWNEEDCDCAEAIIAGALRSPVIPQENEPVAARARMVEAKIERLYGTAPGVESGYVVDAIGQAPLEEVSGEVAPLQSSLQRQPQACLGDANELDFFAPAPVWVAQPDADLADLGRHGTGCPARNQDLYLSEFLGIEDEAGAIEIYNPTPIAIDLGGAGYLIEVYDPDNEGAEEVITLEGRVLPGQTFVVANAAAEERLEEADQVVDIDLGNRAAVVLKRRTVPTLLSCRTPVALALGTLEPGLVFFVEDPTAPRTPNQPPVRVDQEASPN